MSKKIFIILLIFPVLLSFTGGSIKTDAPGKRYRPIVLNKTYEHNKWGIGESDIVYNFAAYTTSFDSDDDDNGDGTSDLWGVPEWVAFEIKSYTGVSLKYKRPSPWLTDDALFAKGIAPNDDTYKVSGRGNISSKVVSGNSRFVRGHMCPKNAADRLGEDAGFNTHTVLNAVPQLQWQNNGIWKALEQECTGWADKYGRIWVVSGPAFFNKSPSMWLGQDGNVKAAIPDATYKIVIRESKASKTGIENMAFIFPNIIASGKKNISEYLTTVEVIEKATGNTFLTKLTKANQEIEKKRNGGLTDSDKKKAFDKW